MNNLILYKGGSTFLLLQNVPDKPPDSPEHITLSQHYKGGTLYIGGDVFGLMKASVKWDLAMKACEESAKDIVNVEEIERKLYQNDKRVTGPMSFDAWRRIILKPGDTFPLPDNVLFEEEWRCGKCGAYSSPERINCQNAYCEKGKVIRLYASKEEESQDDIWRELIDMYDSIDKSSYGYGSLLKLKEHFTIQRNNQKPEETIDVTEYKRRLKEEIVNYIDVVHDPKTDHFYLKSVLHLIDSIDLNKK